MLNKFSACDSGLVAQTGFPSKVASYTPVVCPMPGLDRCDNGNILSSQMAGVDDTNPLHIFVAFATNTAPNNENVLVYDSIDEQSGCGPAIHANGSARQAAWPLIVGMIAALRRCRR